MSSVSGKTVWITGAGSGIGLAAAQELAAAGAFIFMSGRRAHVLEREAQCICEKGFRAEVKAVDVTDPVTVAEALRYVAQQHGRIDILINCVGTNVERRRWDQITVEDWRYLRNANLDGVFYCCRAVLPLMRKQRDGLIINVSSWAARQTLPFSGPAYNAAKRALIALTESINIEEAAQGIRACVICPGEVDTPLLDLRARAPSIAERNKMLRAEDVGRSIRWIAEQPPHVCINEITISPIWNRAYPQPQ